MECVDKLLNWFRLSYQIANESLLRLFALSKVSTKALTLHLRCSYFPGTIFFDVNSSELSSKSSRFGDLKLLFDLKRMVYNLFLVGARNGLLMLTFPKRNCSLLIHFLKKKKFCLPSVWLLLTWRRVSRSVFSD